MSEAFLEHVASDRFKDRERGERRRRKRKIKTIVICRIFLKQYNFGQIITIRRMNEIRDI